MEPLSDSYDPAKTPTKSRRSRSSADDAQFGTVLKKLVAGELEATLPDDEESDPCPTCQGRGFLRRDVPVGDPDFGKVVPCQCTAPAIAQRRLERIFGNAGVPPKLAGLSFATYAQTDGDQQARLRVERWAEREDGESLYLWGDVGRMKTGLGYAAFRFRLEARACDGLFRSSPVLLDAIRQSYDRELGGPRTSEVVDAARGASLLMLDDIGAEKPSLWVIEQLEKLVDHRYLQELPTVFTSNLDLGALAKQLSQRVGSRIGDMCGEDVVRVVGRDQRIGRKRP